jgi:hypothetical protein
MILGMSTATYTMLHVLISFVGIGSGIAVMYGFLKSKRLDGITAIFLLTTGATSVSGFAFPNQHVTPGIVIGILSLLVLAIAIAARYGLHLRGAWRPIYVVTAAIALYFNVFALVVQSFEKVPALNALAPAQKEPPFAVAQLAVLAVFIALTILSVRRFHPDATAAGPASFGDNRREKGAA